MKFIITTLILVSFISASVLADEVPIDVSEAELERLVRQSPKLHLNKLLEYNLEKLEAVYQAALKNADDKDHRTALEASQKAWLGFFAADGRVADWNAIGGSDAYPAKMEQKIYQVRFRIYQLSTPFRQGWDAVPRVRNPLAEQGGADQPAAAPDSKPEGKEKPKLESEGRSQ